MASSPNVAGVFAGQILEHEQGPTDLRELGRVDREHERVVGTRVDRGDQRSEREERRVSGSASASEHELARGRVERHLRLVTGMRQGLERAHQLLELVDRHDDVQRAAAAVGRVVHADELELAGLARDREHRRARVALREQRIDHEVVVIPVAKVVVVARRDHLADVRRAKRPEREALDLDDIPRRELAAACRRPTAGSRA